MIRIQGHNYRIIYDHKLGSLRQRCGEISPTELVITIHPDQEASQQKETLLHEIIEALKSAFDMDMPHDHVQILGCALHQVMADNPKIFTMALPEGDPQ